LASARSTIGSVFSFFFAGMVLSSG